MKNRGRCLMILSIIGIFSFMALPVVNAETFDIGTKIAESDLDTGGHRLHYFDSGCVIRTKPDYIDFVPLILDGNESTGIDYNFGPSHDKILFYLVFPYPFNVSNITLKPVFHGNASEYGGQLLIYINSLESWYNLPYGEDKIIYINGTINTIRLYLDSNGTNHFYFNDMIINYTPSLSNLDEIRNQVNYLTAQFNLLNTKINELNNSINELNLTQEEILENITNLLAYYNQLNESFMNFIGEFESLDNRVFQLESENAVLKLEVENLTREIENLKGIETERIIEKQPDNVLVHTALILGILGIILALIAIILIFKKFGSEKSSIEKEQFNDLINPERNDK